MLIDRRGLLAGASASLAFAGLGCIQGADAQPAVRGPAAGYGPLRPDPAGLFDLPDGFSYQVISQAGQPMSDGYLVPGNLDGMACFPLSGSQVVLVRNQEHRPPNIDTGPFGPGRTLASRIDRAKVFDVSDDGIALGGGTTSIVYDLASRRVVSEHLSLAGTLVNCAGGVTPEGSWLSCEETTQGRNEGVRQNHGWVFEVPSTLRGLADPVAITGMGRFKHEATATDPRTGIVYQTEDMGDGRGLFYRYLPNDRRRLQAGGRLQALGFRDGSEADPRNWDRVWWRTGDWRDVVWIDVDGVDNPYEDLRYRGHERGAAWFARGEGIWFGEDELYFTCTSGGPRRLGQVLRYRPSEREGQPGERDEPGRLQLFVQPEDPVQLQMPDNITIAPWGHLVVCEDKPGANHLKGITPTGQTYEIGRNPKPLRGDPPANSELAGACFSPDGSVLFLNIWSPGTTLAIRGPWRG